MEVTIFTKIPILDVWKGSEYVVAEWTIKTIKPHKANTNCIKILKQAIQSLENLWNISCNGIKWTESNNLPTKLALPYHPRSSLINNLIFNLFTTVSIWCTYLQACWNSHKLFLLQFYQTCNRLLQPSYSLKKSG